MTLDQWMRDKDISNTALAELIGVSRPYIKRLREGERQPSLPVAVKLAKVTRLPVSAFIKDVA